MPPAKPIILATRGSALALAQAHEVLARCRAAFPRLRLELKIIKTTGDRRLGVSLARGGADLPKGLFTKELEVALLRGQADLAVHSLKDLPTEVPAGLKLGAVSAREDVRDVLIYRDAAWLAAQASAPEVTEWSPGHAQRRGMAPGARLADLPPGATVATSSTRRQAQLLHHRPDLHIVEVRGNVVTRLRKLAAQPEWDALVLAAAGLRRLNFTVTPDGHLQGDAVPDGLCATVLTPEEMLPCVGQAALGIEVREADERVAALCARLNHYHTHQCVLAERAFLAAMGGGCASPVAALAEVRGEQLRMRVISFAGRTRHYAEGRGELRQPVELGQRLAAELKARAGAGASAPNAPPES